MIVIVAKSKPDCEICNLPMHEWNPWADKHIHNHCIAEQMSDRLAEVVKDQLDNNIPKGYTYE